MADKHPYVLSPLHISQLVNQLRKSFPSGLVVNSEMLKKIDLAPNNEGYVINTVRFLGIIDDEGKKTERAGIVFSKHDDSEFSQEFSELVITAYKSLFDLHGDASWTLDQKKLISFFRGTDQTGENVGLRQAKTFQGLATISGKLSPLPTKEKTPTARKPPIGKKKSSFKPPKEQPKKKEFSAEITTPLTNDIKDRSVRDFGLTVRIEINLPAGADKETYDNIFRSIRENLIDVE